MSIDCCDHGRPLNSPDMLPCDDCYEQEWVRTRKDTYLGLAFLLALIYVPLILTLMGVFW